MTELVNTPYPTQYQEIRQVWLNALNQLRVEDLLLHFPSGKFGFTLECDMTPLDALMIFIESYNTAKLNAKPVEVTNE